MPAPMSRDLRERIVRAVEDGSSMRAAAARFAVSPSSAIKLMARVRATGSVAPARYGGHRRPILGPHEGFLRALVAAQPDITLREIQAELRSRCAGIRNPRADLGCAESGRNDSSESVVMGWGARHAGTDVARFAGADCSGG